MTSASRATKPSSGGLWHHRRVRPGHARRTAAGTRRTVGALPDRTITERTVSARSAAFRTWALYAHALPWCEGVVARTRGARATSVGPRETTGATRTGHRARPRHGRRRVGGPGRRRGRSRGASRRTGRFGASLRAGLGAGLRAGLRAGWGDWLGLHRGGLGRRRRNRFGLDRLRLHGFGDGFDRLGRRWLGRRWLGGYRLVGGLCRLISNGFLAQLADHRCLDGRGCRTYELPHVVEGLQQFLAFESELFRELVDADLGHYSPSGPRRRVGPLVLFNAHFEVLIEWS